MMASRLVQFHSISLSLSSPPATGIFKCIPMAKSEAQILGSRSRLCSSRSKRSPLRPCAAALRPLDLTEDNVRQVLIDARSEFAQLFDASVGMTGEVDLAELDGPFVKISLKGRFWHERAVVLARLGTYLKNRIPEILEVDIEDEKQLDDSPENF